MISYSDLDFDKKGNLMHGTKKTGFSVVPYEVEGKSAKFYKIMFPAMLSDDFYNLTRAKDFCRKLYQNLKNREEAIENSTEVSH